MLMKIALSNPSIFCPLQAPFLHWETHWTNHHAHLGVDQFEQLQILKLAWKDDILDIAAWNPTEIEEVKADMMNEYQELLAVDNEAAQWDKEFSIVTI